MKPFLILLAILCGCNPAAAQDPAPKPAAAKLPESLVASLESHPNLTYARYGDRELQLDLFRPKDSAGRSPRVDSSL